MHSNNQVWFCTMFQQDNCQDMPCHYTLHSYNLEGQHFDNKHCNLLDTQNADNQNPNTYSNQDIANPLCNPNKYLSEGYQYNHIHNLYHNSRHIQGTVGNH